MSAIQDDRSYSEKLRDPRWQRKRLEIMQRDGFRCVECGSERITLNVHHRRYVRGRDPWDYDQSLLVTLCEKCHEFYSYSNVALTAGELFEEAMRAHGFDTRDMARMMSVFGVVPFNLSQAQRQAITDGFVALALEVTGCTALQDKAKQWSADVEEVLCRQWTGE